MARSGGFDDWLTNAKRRPPRQLARAPEWLRHILIDRRPMGRWDAGIDVEAAINEVGGPFIEIGGPSAARETLRHRHIYDTAKLDKPLVITNRTRSRGAPPDRSYRDLESYRVGRAPWYTTMKVSPKILDGRLDLLADATSMPLADDSVGFLSATALYYHGTNLNPEFLQEARRALKPGGFVAVESVDDTDLEHLRQLEFEPVRATRRWHYSASPGPARPQFDVIARKPGAAGKRIN